MLIVVLHLANRFLNRAIHAQTACDGVAQSIVHICVFGQIGIWIVKESEM